MISQPQSVTIYFSVVALCIETVFILAILLGKWKWFTDKTHLPSFTIAWKNPTLACVISQMIGVMMFHISQLSMYTTPFGDKHRCDTSSQMLVFSYVLQCFFVYVFLLLKIQTTFLGHTKFTSLMERGLKLVTFCCIPILGIVAFFLFDGKFYNDGYGTPICVMMTTPFWIIVLAVLDIILNLGFLLLFVLPLRQLIQAEDMMAKSDPAARTSNDLSRRKLLMDVARRNLIATSACVTVAIVSFSVMVWQTLTDDLNGKVFGCFPCGIAALSNSVLLLITTKGAWRRDEVDPAVSKEGTVEDPANPQIYARDATTAKLGSEAQPPTVNTSQVIEVDE